MIDDVERCYSAGRKNLQAAAKLTRIHRSFIPAPAPHCILTMDLRLVFLVSLMGCVSPKEEQDKIEQSFLLPGKCTEDGSCGINGTCTAGSRKCICGPDYTARTDRCVSRGFPVKAVELLTDAAYNTTTGECLPPDINFKDGCGTFGGVCDGTISGKKCKCPPGKFFEYNQCVPSAFSTETCSVAGKTCSFKNGICSFTKSCTCKLGYYVEYDRCVSKTFKSERYCPPNGACGEEGYCGNNVTCVCFPDYFAHGTRCLSVSFRSHPDCWKAGACAFGNGKCASGPGQDPNRCICQYGYYKEGDQCVTPYFKAPVECRAVGDKCDSERGVCSDHEICQCNAGFFVKRGRCVRGSFVSKSCVDITGESRERLCDDGRGKCAMYQMCQCSNQSWVDNGTCVFPSFTEKGCQDGEECSHGKGVCDGNSTCVCKSRYLVYPVYATDECRSLPTEVARRAVSSVSSLASSAFCLATLVTIAGASTLFWY
ncbi:hypothetical protein BaRGS_00013218 [Batillaria attramentaria]|uniref:EGF-like domain-containing protein n=1 Tax=Batillaria attramentaria TaxID=370345 RepID=A0ABD0L8L9_9CAEN